MIYESYYWKKELLSTSKMLLKRTNSKRWWTEAQYGTFEKEIMIGFYMIRKLIDTKTKVTNALVSKKLEGKKYPNKDKSISWRNNHKFYEYYDFEKSMPCKLDLKFLCNQIIHSFIFSPVFDCNEEQKNRPSKLRAVFINSDENCKEWLFEISIESIIKIFSDIGSDYPTALHYTFDPRKNNWKRLNTNEMREIPENVLNLTMRNLNDNQ